MFPTRILLATNGSGEAAVAEEAAVEMAEGTGSELHVVYVVSTVPQLPHPHPAAKERSETVLELRKIGGLRVLSDRIRRIEELGGSTTASYYREGRPEQQIVGLAEELDAGLILTGGHKRPWFERVFGAGFSQNLLRKADRPVLVVGDRGRRGSAVPKR